MASSPDANPAASTAVDVRTAAKFLIAGFGAVGAVLVANLSFSSLASGQHPFVAGVAAVAAILGVAVAVSLVVDVLVPRAVTLQQLASLQVADPDHKLIRFLTTNEELFLGYPADLAALRATYLDALQKRKDTELAYLEDPTDANKQAAELADAREQFVSHPVDNLLDIAATWQIIHRFTDRRYMITAAALATAAAVGVFAWASTKASAKPGPPPSNPPSATTGPSVVVSGNRLRGSDLRGARLQVVDLRNATLIGVDLKGSSLSRAVVNKTTRWERVVCPDGTVTGSRQPSCVGHMDP